MKISEAKAKAAKKTGYSIETIRKVVTMLKESVNHYMSIGAENIKLCISKGNHKIGKTLNVSLPPVLSCGNCKECKHFCYDIRACYQYSNTVIKARAKNRALLQLDRDSYFVQIDEACNRHRTNKVFRWHVSGDIIDIDYLDRMVKIARNHPDFRFWTYTKMYSIVNAYCAENGGRNAIPANLSILFSEWRGMPMENPYNFGTFRCFYADEEIPANTFYCPGNCDICKAANRGCVVNENTGIYLH